MTTTKVLVVEDDKRANDILKAYLEAEGYRVTVAFNGRDAINEFVRGDPSLVLLDVMLPELDGFAVCKHIRTRATTPIIMLTAKGEEVDKVLGLEFGADDYVTKPFSYRELMARVKATLRREQFHTEVDSLKPISVGNLEINSVQRLVTTNGTPVELAPKEFDLLLFLASHPKQVFRREQLYDKVWGYDYFGGIRTVDVHVTRIRNKIEADPKRPQYLVTVWGVGYKFEVNADV